MRKLILSTLAVLLASIGIVNGQELFSTSSLILGNHNAEVITPLPRVLSWSNDNEVVLQNRNEVLSYNIKKGTFSTSEVPPPPPPGPPQQGQGLNIQGARNITFSPNKKYAAYTKADNNLYSYDLATQKETQLTNDGTEFIKNGWASWVYFEEILGRASRYKAFWFSPDSENICYMRFDDRGLKTFPIYVIDAQYGYLENETYPKAGEANPKVKIGITPVSQAATVWADFDQETDQYFGTPDWSPDNKLLITWMNRDQTDIKIYHINTTNGSKNLWYEEHQSTWITLDDSRIEFLSAGNGFILQSDKDGWQNLYLYNSEGKFINQITQGKNWSTRIVKIDEKNKVVYYTARKEHSARHDFYKSSFDGKKTERLSFGDYSFSGISLSPNGKYYIATYSNLTTPPVLGLIDDKGRLVKVLAESKGKDFEKYALPATELITVKSKDGKFDLPVILIYPINFDKSKKYPVLVSIYGGPNSGTVYDTYRPFNNTTQLWAQEGIIQAVFDNRSSGHFGKEGLNYIHRKLGIWEIEDYMDCGRYLAAQPWVDETKIAITGSSFGGYMTCMALTYGADVFTHGIAGASVTDWQFYDSHYTERFMDRPQDNAEGYEKTSAMTYADRLKGVLKIVHGTSDDNVHFQNSLHLIDKLQELGKPFELMIYPGERHGIGANSMRKGLHNRVSAMEFYYRHLLNKPLPAEAYQLRAAPGRR